MGQATHFATDFALLACGAGWGALALAFPGTSIPQPMGKVSHLVCAWHLKDKCSKENLTLAGLEPAIFGSEDQRLIR